MDLLGDILSALHLEATLYFRAELSTPFAIAVPEERDVIRFHVASEGPCRVALASGAEHRVQPGDLLLVPHGSAHVIADSPTTSPEPLAGVLERTGFDGTGPLVFGGGGPRCVLVCGHFAFSRELTHPVLESLPPLLHLPAGDRADFAWLEQILAHTEREARSRSEGWREIVRRLSEILLVYVLREYSGRSPHSTGALVALSDPQLGAALRAIHEQPGEDWHLEDLARRAGMSRTLFAARFRDALGLTPARYLTVWRMHQARLLLRRPELSAAEVAARVGYASEAAFSRIFKQHFGCPPGRYRQAAPAVPAGSASASGAGDAQAPDSVGRR